jgi:2-hydroxychromene-2-carboxylate isomerase
MAETIDYYFTSASPFTYLGHQAVRAVAGRHQVQLNPKPVNLMRLWEVSGAVPLPKRPPVRQRYRLLELQRVAGFRGLPINVRPKYWPVDPALADHAVIALAASGRDALGFMGRILAAVWANDENIADEATIASCLEAEGIEPGPVLQAARSGEVAAVRARNSEEAVAADAVGVPCYVRAGEPFWGQDRIEYLDQALATRRPPFRAEP